MQKPLQNTSTSKLETVVNLKATIQACKIEQVFIWWWIKKEKKTGTQNQLVNWAHDEIKVPDVCPFVYFGCENMALLENMFPTTALN